MSDTDLPPVLRAMLDGSMEEEHQAWIELCKRISKAVDDGLTPDINGDDWNPVIDQIKFWGETLHRLRLADPEHDARAYQQARQYALDGRA